MSELVPYAWDWEREYAEIRQELLTRQQFRRGGKPYPTELTNAKEIIQKLEDIKPLIKARINEELASDALTAMRKIDEAFVKGLTQPLPTDATHDKADALPRTPSEVQLQHVNTLQYWARGDADEQHQARVSLRLHKYCETACFFPDVCKGSKYRDNCVLRRLSAAIEAPWWLKLVGRRFAPAYAFTESDSEPLRQIRQSMYYTGTQEQEKRLIRIWKYGCFYEPKLCQMWSRDHLSSGKPCLRCRKTAEWHLEQWRKEQTRYDWWTNPNE